MIVYIMLLLTIIAIAVIYYFQFSDGIFNSPLSKGDRGERIVSNHIGNTDENNSYYVINDITIKVGNNVAQIDHLIICQSGIYVIETKNYSGIIIGNNYYYDWTQITKSGYYNFYSPYLQNETHCKRIAEILGTTDYIYNVIVFVKGNTSEIDLDNIYTLKELKEIKYYDEKYLTKEKCIEYYNKIFCYRI